MKAQKAQDSATQCAKIGKLDLYIKRRLDNTAQTIEWIVDQHGYSDDVMSMYEIQEEIAREIPAP